MGAVFNSLSQVLLVFAVLPLAMSGGVLALFLRRMEFNPPAGLAFIVMAGLASLSGVAMVSRIKRLRERNMSLRDAAFNGAMELLRPVLMVSLAVGLGLLPIVLATGGDSGVEQPLATVVVGCLASSLPVMLLLLPTLYTWLEEHRARKSRTSGNC